LIVNILSHGGRAVAHAQPLASNLLDPQVRGLRPQLDLQALSFQAELTRCGTLTFERHEQLAGLVGGLHQIDRAADQ
jgi:hypothetical protein